MKLITALIFLLFVSSALGQIGCTANRISDFTFERGEHYCRADSEQIANDGIYLCTINYDGSDLTAILGNVGNQRNLTSVLFPGSASTPNHWVPTGEIDVIVPHYQPVSGQWALKLNGQFGAGSISETFAVAESNLDCTLTWLAATNIRAPADFRSQYTVVLIKQGSLTPVFSGNYLAQPTSTLNTQTSPQFTLPGSGTYVLSYYSLDNTPTRFSDGLFPAMTYFGRTGAVIDDVCLSCLVTPSPSLTASRSAAPSISRSPAPSTTASPSASASPLPTCPPAIVDDDDYEHWEVRHNQKEENDDEDSTTVNFYFADLMNGGK